METKQVAFTQIDPSVKTNNTGHSDVAIFVGTSVLIYVLLLWALAPRRLSMSRRKSSL